MKGVSVLVAAYNCGAYLDEAINSLLNQTYKDVEIIVCDDCSTDDTLRLLKKYESKGLIKLITKEKNGGAADSRNRCLQAATKDYVAIQDADDYSSLDRFEKQVELLEKIPEIDFVSTGLQRFYETGEKVDIIKPIEFPEDKDFLWALPFMHATTMFRKSALLDVGGYRIAWETRRGQDYDLFLRLYANNHRGINIPDITYFYRCFSGQSSKNSYKYRVGEAVIRYKGFKALHLGMKSLPYVIKPLILGLLPAKTVEILSNRHQK